MAAASSSENSWSGLEKGNLLTDALRSFISSSSNSTRLMVLASVCMNTVFPMLHHYPG